MANDQVVRILHLKNSCERISKCLLSLLDVKFYFKDD